MVDKSKIKNILITNYNFIDNNYLDDYISLIFNADLESAGYREYHHFIPVSVYKEKYNLNTRKQAEKYANKDQNNKVIYLLYKDHCKAHYLLYFCTFGTVKYQNASCFISMISATRRYIQNELPILSEADYNRLQNYMTEIRNDPNSKYFSDSEINFLIENVSILGTTKCAEILKRERTVISTLAVKLGLIEPSGPRIDWTDAEKLWLKENIKKYSRKDCAKILNKTEASIHAMEQRLNISGSRIKTIIWTASDDQWLLQNYNRLDISELMEYLNRSENAIKARLRILGISQVKLIGKTNKTGINIKFNRKSWSQSEIEWLNNNYKQLSIKECAKILNRSESAIEHALYRYNLK